MVDKVIYNNLKYDVIDKIEFSSRTYLIIKHQKDLKYIELYNNQYILPPNNLTIQANQGKSLTYLRQQYLLKYLLSFITAHDLNTLETKEIIQEFKDFIKTDKINEYLYSKYLDESKFNNEINQILYDLQTTLELSLECEYIVDPSYQYSPKPKEIKQELNPKYEKKENIETYMDLPKLESNYEEEKTKNKKNSLKGVLEALTLIFPVATIEVVSFLIIIYWR